MAHKLFNYFALILRKCIDNPITTISLYGQKIQIKKKVQLTTFAV